MPTRRPRRSPPRASSSRTSPPSGSTSTLTLPDGPIDPAAPPTLSARADFLWGAPGADLPLEGETRIAMARDVPGHPGFLFGLEDEPFTSGYAALAPATTDAAGAAQIPLAIPESGPVSRPLALTATLRVRDGSGRPVERSETRPILPGRAADRRPPALRRRGRRGRHRRLRGDRPRPRPRAHEPRRRRLDALAHRDRLPVVRGRRRLELRADHPAQPRGERHASTSPPACRCASTCPSTGAATSSPSPPPTAATSPPASASTPAGAPPAPARRRPTCSTLSLDRAAYAPGDTARARVVAPNPGQLLVAVMGDRLIETRTLAVDGRRDRRRPARHRRLGRRRLRHRDPDPPDGRRRRPQPGPRHRPRLGAGRPRPPPPRRRLRGRRARPRPAARPRPC